MKKCFVLLLLLFLFGCASVFNPYESQFQCPPTDLGKCMPIKEAYEESLKHSQSAAEGSALEGLYAEEKFKLLKELIEEPEPPVVKPPKILRVLILSYVGEENELYGWRYVYLMIDSPSWVIGVGREELK